MSVIHYEDLGIKPYAEAWQYQEQLFNESITAKLDKLPTKNTLLLCEHPHVMTIGRNGKAENLLFTDEYLKSKNISLFRTDRGGDITYHGPGQLVAYPIFDLETFGIGLKQYVYNLEEVMIRFLALYGVMASRSDGAGVWLDVDNASRIRKIGAIGVRSSRFVTMHGFALNLNSDLSFFSLINPCGYADRGVTSLQKEIGTEVDLSKAKREIRLIFDEVFVS